MSDDESSYKARDPRLKKMGHSGDFPPPPGTSDLYSSGDGHRKSRGGHSRSRSRSPESRSRRGRDYDHHSSRNKSANSQDDVWKKNTDAFLQNLGASPGIVPQMGVPPPGYHPPYGGYPPQMGYAPYGAAPGYPPQMPGYGMPEMEDPRSRSSQSHQRQASWFERERQERLVELELHKYRYKTADSKSPPKLPWEIEDEIFLATTSRSRSPTLQAPSSSRGRRGASPPASQPVIDISPSPTKPDDEPSPKRPLVDMSPERTLDDQIPLRNLGHREPSPDIVELAAESRASSSSSSLPLAFLERLDERDRLLLLQSEEDSNKSNKTPSVPSVATRSEIETLPIGIYVPITWDIYVYQGHIMQIGAFDGQDNSTFNVSIYPKGNPKLLESMSSKRIMYKTDKNASASNRWKCIRDGETHDLLSIKAALHAFLAFLKIASKKRRPVPDGTVLISFYEEDISPLIKAVERLDLESVFKESVKGLGDLTTYLSRANPGCIDDFPSMVRNHCNGEHVKYNAWCDTKAKHLWSLSKALLGSKVFGGNPDMKTLSALISPLTSSRITRLMTRRTLQDRIRLCLPLEQYLAEKLAAEGEPEKIVTDGLFKPSNIELEKASAAKQAANAMCKILVDSDLDFDKLHGIYSMSGIGDLELSLRTAFMHKMVGQPRNVVDQVVRTSRMVLSYFKSIGNAHLSQLMVTAWEKEEEMQKNKKNDEYCLLADFLRLKLDLADLEVDRCIEALHSQNISLAHLANPEKVDAILSNMDKNVASYVKQFCQENGKTRLMDVLFRALLTGFDNVPFERLQSTARGMSEKFANTGLTYEKLEKIYHEIQLEKGYDSKFCSLVHDSMKKEWKKGPFLGDITLRSVSFWILAHYEKKYFNPLEKKYEYPPIEVGKHFDSLKYYKRFVDFIHGMGDTHPGLYDNLPKNFQEYMENIAPNEIK